ncbi:MAG: hypothetical protein JNJ73_16525 [Hyphomonadaceae bacterium]|nr:hypothetical protein [Hyphomonadaceae bacterium]
MRVAAAAAIYFALVFAAGLLLGPIRVLWLEPRMGETLATACEAPFLVLAMVFAAERARRWTRVAGPWPKFLAIGLLALVLQQAADFALGVALRGATLQTTLAHFTTPPGWIYAAALILFALMPLLRRPS